MTREQQKEARRQDILLKAMELFVTKGYHETRISDIAGSVHMSTGLLFHYFESKEQLYCELVRLGAEKARTSEALAGLPPEAFFEVLLQQMFSYAAGQPWVFQMFVLMGQARREGMPEEARRLAASIGQLELSARVIAAGQASGVFRQGDPQLLSMCFWASVQGVMEQAAANGGAPLPQPEWLTAMLKK